MRCWTWGLLLSVAASAVAHAEQGPLDWPAQTNVSRPWAYWWWMGSAVNEADLTRELERYAKSGMGGVHIIPIYGAKGYEKQYIDYLSPRWMAMLKHTITEARRLGMDVDMTLGTGWCFGGPQITDRDANARLVVKTIRLAAGARLKEKFDREGTQAIVAFAEKGEPIELTSKIGPDGTVDWVAPAGAWRVYVVSQRPSGQKVKRAAPGGAGWMLNPFYGQATVDFLSPFTAAFAKYDGPLPRAVYHDSYEYQSNWSPDLLEQFEKRRGYRLQDHLPELMDDSKDEDAVARVKADYRETLSDLMVEQFMPTWVDWAHERRLITRNEAHGSPGNLLDLYAAADIPETEMFNKDRNPLVAKFASSAAHLNGRRLVSAETGTWMAEHFTETLAQMKGLVDEMFVSGVNHVFYHGTCYSPDDAPWPGWVFYASTEMNPRNSIWRDVGTLNAYIARCQSVLQAGKPDNDVLLYWPIHDLWHSAKGLVQPLTVHHTDWLMEQPVGKAAEVLWKDGYQFDYISDRQLQRVQPGNAPGVIVVPRCVHMPVETMQKLMELAKGRTRVIFQDAIPVDVPGFASLQARRAQLAQLTAGLKLTTRDDRFPNVRVGDLSGALTWALAYHRENLPDSDLRIVRRRSDDARYYFVLNAGSRLVDCWLPLNAPSPQVLMMDPMTGRSGLAETSTSRMNPDVHLQLRPGETVILRTLGLKPPTDIPKWDYQRFDGKTIELSGEWRVKFVSGGPEFPREFATEKLESWTDSGDERAKAFAGTAIYSISFDAPAARCLLDLGKVCESARVRVNGKDVATLIGPSYRVVLEGLKEKGNLLEVEVTNTSANRIRDLDRRGVKWRNFSDINFVNIDYKPFDASTWPLRESGLIGPVTLQADK
jgi:hypothetical protein